MQGTDITIAAPSEPENNQQGQRGSAITPTEIAAVDELCNILARVLMRVQAEQEPADQGKGDRS